MIVVLMGPSGAGKTTVGQALASDTGWPFVDADDLHPEANVAKIRAGVPLTDADRAPWLQRLRAIIETADQDGANLIVACSALRQQYRDTLADGVTGVRWVLLSTSRAELQRRLETRVGHFAGPAILEDQLRTLEEPDDALVVDSERPVPALVAEICARLRLTCRSSE